jgi:hypothetical protein
MVTPKNYDEMFYNFSRKFTCQIPEAEPYIMKDEHWAYRYAHDIIKGRWLEAEPKIMKNAIYAYWYARRVINGRWPEAEKYIKKNGYWWGEYYKDLIK